MIELLIHPSHEQYLQHQLGVALGSVEFDLGAAVRTLIAGELPKKKPKRRDYFFYTFGPRIRIRLALTPREERALRIYALPDRSRTSIERMVEAHAQALGYMIGMHTCGPFCGANCPQKRRSAKKLTPVRTRARLRSKSRS